MGLLLCLIRMFAFWPVVSSDELLVVGDSLEFIPSLEVKRSPGLNQEVTSICGRIHIYGYTRPYHLHKSIKLTIDAPSGSTSDIDVCIHRNLSRAIGMCPHDQWKKVSNGSLIQTMIPFDHKILDVRIASPSKVTLKVSTVEEWCIFRILCLILGTVLFTWASPLSKSVQFYHTSAIFAWFIIVPLLILFQIMKNLPTRLFSWVSSIAVVGFLVRYTPVFIQIIRKAAHLDRYWTDKWLFFLHISTSYMMGIYVGLAFVSGLVLTKDGSIDIGTSIFFSWSIWILAMILILQSSIDPLLAGGALLFVIAMSPMLKKITRLILTSGRALMFVTFMSHMLKNITWFIFPLTPSRGRRCDPSLKRKSCQESTRSETSSGRSRNVSHRNHNRAKHKNILASHRV